MGYRIKQIVFLVVVIAVGYFVYTKFFRDLSAKSDDELFKMYASDDFSDSKPAEIEILRRVEDRKLTESALTKQFEKADPKIKAFAAECLGRAREKSAIPKLKKALHDSNAEVRAGACRAFQYLRSKDAVDRLIDLLDDKDLDVSSNASKALDHYTAGEVKFKQGGKAQWREWWNMNKNTFRPPGE
jgi:HEAT repeat protein